MPSADLSRLSAFLLSSQPGESFEYFRGRLDVELAGLDADAEARRIRKLVYAAAQDGKFELAQQRHGFDDYSYLIRRRRPSPRGRVVRAVA